MQYALRGDKAGYLDDLAMKPRDPQAIVENLKFQNQSKLKGTGPSSNSLLANLKKEQDGVLSMTSSKYINQMMD